jgi:uncharacterized protein
VKFKNAAGLCMEPSTLIILAVLVAACVAAAVQGAVGFGFGLVSVALFSTFLDAPRAAMLNAVPALAVNGLMLWRLRPHLSLEGLKPIAIAMVLATPIGVALLDRWSAGILHALLAAVLVVSVAQSLCPRGGAKPWHPYWTGVPMGVLSGVLTGVLGGGGPPLVAFVASQHHDKLRYAACVQALLALANTIRIVEIVRRGTISTGDLHLSLLSVPAALVGAAIGIVILRRLSAPLLRKAVASLLLLVAIRSAIAAAHSL